jgi:hypothetical protein
VPYRGRAGWEGGRVYVPFADRHNVTTRMNIGDYEGLDRHTDRHRASQIARTVTKSAGALGRRMGVGDARVEKYGAAVLERLVFDQAPG